jgi:hypothetical protein
MPPGQRDFQTLRLAGSVTLEEGCSVPHRWEVVNVMGRGRRIMMLRAFDLPVICEKLLAKNDKGQRGMKAMRSGDLCLQ